MDRHSLQQELLAKLTAVHLLLLVPLVQLLVCLVRHLGAALVERRRLAILLHYLALRQTAPRRSAMWLTRRLGLLPAVKLTAFLI